MNTFIQVLFGLTEVQTVLQCSFMSPYTNSQIYSLWNIFPTTSRFLHRTGLPTHRSVYRFTYSASPIGPNRSGPRLLQPIRPMLSLSLNKDIVAQYDCASLTHYHGCRLRHETTSLPHQHVKWWHLRYCSHDGWLLNQRCAHGKKLCNHTI